MGFVIDLSNHRLYSVSSAKIASIYYVILTPKNSYFHYSLIEVIEQIVILAYGRNFALCQSFLFIFNGYFLPKVATYSQVAATTKN